MKQLNLEKIKATFNKVPDEFEGMVAQIGFPLGKNYPDGTPVAYVATIQEFGAPAVNIPPRPFIQPTVRAKKKYWSDILAAQIPKVVLGKTTAFDALDLVGMAAKANIQEKISSIYEPPNSPATIKRKGSAKPLIDTGYMLASVSNSVAKEGSDFVARD